MISEEKATNSTRDRNTQRKGHKVVGSIAILLGLACIVPLFVLESTRLLYQDTFNFFLRYFKPTLLTNGSLYFLTLGILFYVGVLIPHYSANPIQKAKLDIFSGIFLTPFMISTTVALLTVIKEKGYTIFWLLSPFWFGLVIYYVALVLYRLKTLRKTAKQIKTT